MPIIKMHPDYTSHEVIPGQVYTIDGCLRIIDADGRSINHHMIERHNANGVTGMVAQGRYKYIGTLKTLLKDKI